MKMKGAKVLVECFREQGVDTIFGFPGGSVLDIYDALYDERQINHIITVHEQGATHAADGYARTTGKVGVVLVTSGPGASNTITGIANAYMDSVPLVIITGQVARHLLGKSSFQEINITDIAKTITKKTYRVMEPEMLPGIIREAFKIAASGRPGPVLIDIPKDVQQAEIEYIPEVILKDVQINLLSGDTLEKIALVQEYINKSLRPVIFSGGGVLKSNASKELIDLAERIKSPVACSLMGLGSFPGDHPLYTGMVGMHGSYCSNYAFTNSDLLIALGTRFSDRVICNKDGFAPNARIIHIDIDPAEFGKNIDASNSLCGDIKDILSKLLENIETRSENDWNIQMNEWKKKFDEDVPFTGSLSPQYLIKKLYELTNGDSIICTEVGQNQMWAAQYYKYKEPRSFISSGGLGTMGFGLGAAIGSKIARPDKRVINIAGDGSFKMNMQELATISKYNIPIIQLVLNNSTLGMVRQWQRLFYNNRISYTDITPDVDFCKLAEAFGIKSMVIRSNEEVEEVLTKALSLNVPVVIDCIIDHDNMVVPMVPLGESIDNCVSTFS